MSIRTVFRGTFCIIIIAATLPGISLGAGVTAVSDTLHERALDELDRALHEGPPEVTARAAQVLLALGYHSDIAAVLERTLSQHAQSPGVRIGLWRALAELSPRKQRDVYIGNIRDVIFDPDASDRTEAVEALCHLRGKISRTQRDAAAGSSEVESVLMAPLDESSGPNVTVSRLVTFLDSPTAELRGAASRALQYSPATLSQKGSDELIAKSLGETVPAVRFRMLNAAYLKAFAGPHSAEIKKHLLSYLTVGSSNERFDVTMSLASRGQSSDIPLLTELLEDRDIHVRIAAANSVLRIQRRETMPFEALDWIVLGVYAAGMLAIGVFYQRRNKDADDYLLGGRTMTAWSVGISLFATLMSTLTYLAVPGEMIQHGPMILSRFLAFPFVYIVVSRFIIPFVMKSQVTSAYELLERRLGLSVRLLGSALFLLLRLLWMALIVYATSSAVLVPLLRLNASATPWVSMALAVVTVAYTSMGGLKAVVFTDVLQTFIMIGGAVLSVVVITVKLGSVAAWWPTSWSSDWDAPSFLFATDARVTASMAIVTTFVWYVCTAGSDQMAVQRYLATRDAKAARQMFGISLISDVLVSLLLAVLGLSLFAYFKAYPAMLPDGGTLYTSADQLLPQFIVKVLPAGISGLVVAGILSAAMDSLSSGVNASCSVVTVDWIDRFRGSEVRTQQTIHQATVVSWLIGLVVIALSLFAGYVEGNLLEKCYTVINLFTVPLFLLFFMAMFVPWATSFGSWCAVVSSTGVAIAMAYGSFLNLSFLWIMPVSLAVGSAVGCIASLVGVSTRSSRNRDR